jgi:drug/metabolite transporter (DMT)-like permease
MTQQLNVSPRAWFGILALALIGGASFLSVRVALDEVPVTTVVAFRVGGAALALWVYVLARRMPLPRGGRVWIGIAVMGILNNALPFTLITWGQQYIPSGLASILNASTAIFGVLIAALVFADERLSPRKVAGVVLGFAGVATAVGLANLGNLDPRSLGQWAVVGAALSYGVSGSWARARLTGVPPVVLAATMLTASSCIMAPAALLIDGVPSFAYAPQTYAALGYLSLIASGIAYLIFYWVLGQAGAGNVSLTTLLIAPVAILLGAVVLDEPLRPPAFAGFGRLALGLLILDGWLVARLRRAAPTRG